MGIASTIIGTLAGVGTTISFMPQVIHMFRAQTTKGVSPVMLIIHLTGVSLWTGYGIMIMDPILIGFNVVTVVLVSMCLGRYTQVSYYASIPPTVV